ncbi:MAG TPA: penicillin acylase family protein, partial [Dyadobacter sp.]|nr:penicillin acylase family protein [Dyadobacter sp.]
NGTALTPGEKAAKTSLDKWNYQNNAESIPASIFETWFPLLQSFIWDDEFGSEKILMKQPTRDRTIYMLLNQPNEKWFDDINTSKKETMPDIVLASFKASLDTLKKHHGEMSPKWGWSDVKNTEIRHLSRSLKPFNAPAIKVGGGSGIVNAITKRNGPSWRMVVELGPNPKAYGIYPGGQSGNPGSPYYLNLLKKWENGELNELVFLSSPDQTHPRLTSGITFKKN